MKLKEYREKSNLTQKEMSKILKIAQGSYSNYELGKREPDIKTLIQLSKLFNVSVDTLIGNTTNEITTPLTKLNNFEQELIETFDNLTPIGQGQVLGYARKTLEQEKQDKESQLIKSIKYKGQQ